MAGYGNRLPDGTLDSHDPGAELSRVRPSALEKNRWSPSIWPFPISIWDGRAMDVAIQMSSREVHRRDRNPQPMKARRSPNQWACVI